MTVQLLNAICVAIVYHSIMICVTIDKQYTVSSGPMIVSVARKLAILIISSDNPTLGLDRSASQTA